MLEKEQEDLLGQLVAATQDVPREDREFFYFSHMNGEEIMGPAQEPLASSKGQVLRRDLLALRQRGLLTLDIHDHDISFAITADGYAHVSAYVDPLERQENTVRRYLQSEGFRESFPSVYEKWADAETLLWQDNADLQLSTIGHKCREVFQDFAARLVEQHKPPGSPESPAAVTARIRAVLDMYEDELGEKRSKLVLALVAYWSASFDITQRQTKGQLKDEPLNWLDGRRVVFHTASAMFEVASLVEDLPKPPPVAVMESGR